MTLQLGMSHFDLVSSSKIRNTRANDLVATWEYKDNI